MSLAEAAGFALGDEEVPKRGAASSGGRTDISQEMAGSPGNVFLREGEFWVLEFAGESVHVKDGKGLRDLAVLLGCPGREIAAVWLLAGPPRGKRWGIDHSTVAEEGWGLEGHIGAVIDAEARQKYRQRLADLEEELASAEAASDPERACRASRGARFLAQ